MVAAPVSRHHPEHEGGDHGRPAVPEPGRVPHLRQHLRDDRGGQRHGVGVVPRLPGDHLPRGDRHGVSGLGSAVPLCGPHRLRLHQGLQDRPGTDERGRLMSRREKTWWWIAGVVILLYCLFPIAWIISLSFKGPADIANQQFLPTTATTENYSTILTGSASDLFLPALRNSFGICLIATFISCILSMFAAYAIARLDFPGKRLILSAALAVAIFPVISIVTPLFNLWR